MKHKAFTLIELLVVVFIIALLIGVLLPTLATARQSAMAVKCLSNTRAIAVVMDLYASDDARNFYPTARMPATAPIETSWVRLTEPYLHEIEVYQCPTDTSDNWHDPSYPRFTSYGINAYFTPNHPPYFGITPSQIKNPSRTIIAAELVENLTSDHFMPMYWGSPPDVTSAMMQSKQWDTSLGLPRTIFVDRHRRTANYVFTDGHAANHQFDDTWQQTSGSQATVNWFDPFND